MAQCAFIKTGGARCGGTAKAGATLCYSHDPARAEERKRNAVKGGKKGGRGRSAQSARDVAQIRDEVRRVVAAVLSGRLDRRIAAVGFQGYNVLLKAVEVERKVKEADEFEARIGELERVQAERGGERWGA